MFNINQLQMNPTELIKMKVLNQQNKPKSTWYQNKSQRGNHRQSFDNSASGQQIAKQKYGINTSAQFGNDHLAPPLASRQPINSIKMRQEGKKIQFDYKNQAEKLNQICQQLYKENERLRQTQGTFERDRIIWDRRINQLENEISKYHSILKNKNTLIEQSEKNSEHRAHRMITHRRTSSNINGNSTILYQNDQIQHQMRSLLKQLEEKDRQLKKYVQKEARYIEIYVYKEQLQHKIRQLQDLNYAQNKKLEDMTNSRNRDQELSIMRSSVVEPSGQNHTQAYEEKLRATLLQSKQQNERLTIILIQKEEKLRNKQAELQQILFQQLERTKQYENKEAYLNIENQKILQQDQRLTKQITLLEAQLHEKDEQIAQLAQMYRHGQLKIQAMVCQIEKLKQQTINVEKAGNSSQNEKNRQYQVMQIMGQNKILREQVARMERVMNEVREAKDTQVSKLADENKSLWIKIADLDKLLKQKISFLAKKLEQGTLNYKVLLNKVQKAAQQEESLKIEISRLCEANIKYLGQNYRLSLEETEMLKVPSRRNSPTKQVHIFQVMKN